MSMLNADEKIKKENEEKVKKLEQHRSGESVEMELDNEFESGSIVDKKKANAKKEKPKVLPKEEAEATWANQKRKGDYILEDKQKAYIEANKKAKEQEEREKDPR